MSNIKKIPKIRKSEYSLNPNSKNILPIIGSPKQTINKKNLTNNKILKENKFNTIDKKIIENNVKNSTSNKLINSKNNSIIEGKIEDYKKGLFSNKQNNNKIIYSRNINGYKSKSNPNYNTLNKEIKPEIINEISNDRKKFIKLTQNVYKIILVFRNEDFYLSVKPDTIIKNLRLTISKLLNLDFKQVSMIFEDKEIDVSNDEKSINEYFNFKKLRSRPIIYIKKKFVSNNNNYINDNSSNFFLKKIYNNKVKITNFPSISDINVSIKDNINNVISNFFKSNSSFNDNINENNQYRIENENYNLDENNNTYIIGFSSPDLAFDFNRYINSLKLINPIYKEVKSKIIFIKKRDNSDLKIKNNSNKNTSRGNLRYGIDYNLEENNLTKRNSNILKLIRNNFLKRKLLKKEKNNSQIFINISGPYLSSFDKDIIEQKENKKKWINPEGFISCVGKYSGIQL